MLSHDEIVGVIPDEPELPLTKSRSERTLLQHVYATAAVPDEEDLLRIHGRGDSVPLAAPEVAVASDKIAHRYSALAECLMTLIPGLATNFPTRARSITLG